MTTQIQENAVMTRIRQLKEDGNSLMRSAFLNSQKISEQKLTQAEQLLKSSRGAQLENMKNHTVVRPKSNEKIGSIQGLGSTGGSQSSSQPALIKKPSLKLNTNLTSQVSIAMPQTTTNSHSNRMANYLTPHNQSSMTNSNSHSRVGFTSTPKNQSMSHHSIGQSNYSSTMLLQAKHRSQGSSSQVNQGAQGSQGGMTQELSSFNPTKSQGEIVKVGTSVPKTTTAANLKNFNNLRQFNQIFNQPSNKSPQLSQYQTFHHQSTQNTQQDKQALDNETHTNNNNTNSNSQKQLLLQNHQRHLQQQSQNKQQLKPKVLSDSTDKVNQSSTMTKLNPKNLQINIPSSPRDNDNNDKFNKSEKREAESNNNEKEKGKIHSGSMSTTNANQGNIKLNKFTCHSTRNNSQKQNIFGKNNKTEKTDEGKETQGNFDSMQLQPAHKIIVPNHESTKHSLKRNGVVRAYAANTNQGLVRNYNEDRVSIILNILKPPNRQAENWPRCSFFGIYDGHGGSACADFLRDNLHQFVIKEQSFPSNPKEALRSGFMNAEKKFIELCQNENGIIDKSGSCAIVVLIVEDMCYVANVGDSRALLSGEEGKRIFPLSRDHKPCDELERKRIIEGGGQIYHRTATTQVVDANDPNKKEVIVGPLRVLPGRLSVSRTFGDAEAKLSKFGGNPNVVVATPEIKSFRITRDHDFIVLGCDGIFDKLNNKDTISCVWNSVKDNKQLGFAQNIHKQSGMGVEYILKNSLLRRTLDNVTVVLIAFSNFKHSVFGQGKTSSRPEGDSKVQNHHSNSQSTDNSQAQNNTQRAIENKKENIPPPDNKEQLTSSKFGNSQKPLSIYTNQGCSMQGLKTTTHAQVNNQLTQSNRVNQQSNASISQQVNNKRSHYQPSQLQISNGCQSSTNNKPKHFDFANI